MANNKDDINRLFVFEPNPDENRLIPNEDYSILVELKTTKKGRSFIIGGGVENIGGAGGVVNFIAGTKVGFYSDGKPRNSLTTNYTEASTDFSVDGNTDLETFGIESIEIDFDTAYVPNIKIKFIDIRGQSIFQRGNSSKYSIFFELPYPLFELTVKGFYGKPVTYCLHLFKWNSSFNSSTGNFEVNAEFLGYTYAMLTDMLLGLIRAVITTEEGIPFWAKAKAEYANAGIILKSIDEFLEDINKLADEFKKLKNEDSTVQQLDVNVEVKQILSTIKLKLAELSNDIIGNKNIFNNRDGVLGTSKENANSTKVTTLIKKFKAEVERTLDGDNNDSEANGLNSKIENDELKIKTKEINSITQLNPIKYKDIKGEVASENSDLVKKIRNNSTYSSSDDKAVLLADVMIGNIPGTTADDAEIVIFDLTKAFDEIKRVEVRLEDNNSKIREELGKELARIAEEELDFKPTIRNIFRILTTHCEVFMETLKSVSDKHEDKLRLETLENVRKSEDEFSDNEPSSSVIYPWPEYREKITKNDQTYFEEAWLGKPILKFSNGVTQFNNVPELVFVEHLLEELIKLKIKDDTLRINETFNRIQYYPVSALDSPISSNLITSTPYNAALFGPNTSSKPNEAIRCLLLRGFLAFGVANKNLPNNIIETMGKLEAENLFNTVNEDFDSLIGRSFLQTLTTKGGGDAKKAVEDVIATAKVGYANIVNPRDSANGGRKQPILSESGGNYKYEYIGRDDKKRKRYYIPISSNFDGKIFYDENRVDRNGIPLLKDKAESNTVSDTVLFTRGDMGFFDDDPDGSVYLKIIDSEVYENAENTISPDYGSEVLDEYKKKLKGKLIKQSTLKNATYNNGVISNLDPYSSSRQKSLEITDIIYDDGSEGGSYTKEGSTNGESSVISSYYFNLNTGRKKGLDSTVSVGDTGEGGSYLSTGFDVESANYKNNVLPTIIKTDEDEATYNTIEDTTVNNFYKINKRKLINPRNYGKNREIIGYLLNDISDDSVKPYTPYIEFFVDGYHYSLFGSRLYYGQKNKYAKAYLFLNSFPWQGVMEYGASNVLSNPFFTSIFNLDTTSSQGKDDVTQTLKGLFRNNASFIKAPKLWCAFIGSLIYRYEESNDILTFKEDGGDLLIFYQTTNPIKFPKKDEYLHDEADRSISAIKFSSDVPNIVGFGGSKYTKVEDSILKIPKQIREEFKNQFISFVDDDFQNITESFEIATDLSDLDNKHELLSNAVSLDSTTNINTLKTKDIKTIFSDKINILNNYDNISIDPIENPNLKIFSGEIFLRLKPDGDANSKLNNEYSKVKYILNGNIHGFNKTKQLTTTSTITPENEILVKKTYMDLYLENFFSRLSILVETLAEKQKEESDTIKNDIFNSTDDDFIKLNLYRTLASINNKWLGSFSSKIFQQCGCSNYDLDVAKSEKLDINRLIHSFRFLDVGYTDIGDDFFLNPFAIQKIIVGNYNQSFFDVANKILSDNNFNFIPLPNFINFNDLDEVVDVFRTKPYADAIKPGNQSGPSFVCIYVGQTSTSLDLGEEANYKDDGVVVTLDSNGKILKVPPIFTGQKQNNGDLNIPLFLVSYGLQNQSFFKDIKLDQTEFTETAESLEIIEDISLSGDKRKPSFNGQNLWNVYQKRSYSAEVEMMGCAMIQPFMYFQLDDVPLFRGAYNIYKTSHSITPHNMVTKFKGMRVKRTKTPLISKETLFMNLLGSLNNAAGADGDITNDTNGVDPRDTDANKWLKPFIDTPMNVNMLPIDNSSKAGAGKPVGTVRQGVGARKLKDVTGTYLYGIREWVEYLQTVFKDFQTRIDKLNQTGTDKINNVTYYHDLSPFGGGYAPGHASHQAGTDLDVREIYFGSSPDPSGQNFDPEFFENPENSFVPVSSGQPRVKQNRKGGGGPIILIAEEYTDSNGVVQKDTRANFGKTNQLGGQYSREGTRILLQCFVDNEGKKIYTGVDIITLPYIDRIFFNDPVLIREFTGKFKKGGVIMSLQNHSNHLHVRCQIPERVAKATNNNKQSGENTRKFSN